VRLDPQNFDATANLATALFNLGRNAEALQYFETAYSMKEDNAVLTVNFATFLSSVEQHERALNVLDKALAGDPENASLLATRAAVTKAAAPAKPFDAVILEVQAAISEAVRATDWDRVLSLCVDFGEPKDGAPWWYFTVGMSLIFKY